DLRYKDWDNLQYWFRGVERFAPWVNKIHFVTWGHIPIWLNTAHPKLNIVRHEDFIPVEYLPTFSANPIELNVHRIKGLAEQFVLFNDDMFITRDMKPAHFFAGSVPRDRIALSALTPNDDSISSIMFNDIKTINRHFSKRSLIKNHLSKLLFPHCGIHSLKTIMTLPFKFFTGFYNDHLPYAYTKSLFEEVWEEEGDVLRAACHNKFRDPSDVNQWLMRYWRLAQGSFVKCSRKQGKMLSITDSNDMMFKAILKQKYYMICCNDEGDYTSFAQQSKQLRACFDKLLPKESNFELEQ
ncbi:MAG: hypothetical protein HN948_02345, partial [Clostridia bacterium]|nr:hypothetical protein [Clostridia bacterium]